MDTNPLPSAPRLTPRETELLHLIADGFTDTDIASKLSISKNTVNTHRKKLLRKLNVHNSAHMVKRACLLGIITE